jgi:hypothetical protein
VRHKTVYIFDCCAHCFCDGRLVTHPITLCVLTGSHASRLKYLCDIRYATTHMAGNDEFMLHLLGVAEGIVALAWVSTGLQWRSDLKQTPVQWIEQVKLVFFSTRLSFVCLYLHRHIQV